MCSRSTIGYSTLVGGNLLSWKYKKKNQLLLDLVQKQSINDDLLDMNCCG